MTTTNEEMHIAFSINDKYAQHMGVTVASLLKNYSGKYPLHFYVINTGLSPQNKERLQSLQAIAPFTIDFITVNPDDFADCPNNASYITVEAYFRIKLPQLFQHLDKILYLDVDIVVTGDIATFWDIKLDEDDWIAGVQDLGVDSNFIETLGMKKTSLYINSGVLLMNLNQLRKHNFEDNCFNYIQKHAPILIHVDQDVINPICEGHIKQLEPEFNLLHGYLENPTTQKFPHLFYAKDTIDNACKSPIVIHYTGPTKPWFYKCKNPLAPLYMDYIQHTPWAEYRYPDKTLFAVVKKKLRAIKMVIKRQASIS